MESPRNKMIKTSDLDTKKNRGVKVTEPVIDPNTEEIPEGLTRYFFPTLQKSVLAKSREEAEAIINKDLEK